MKTATFHKYGMYVLSCELKIWLLVISISLNKGYDQDLDFMLEFSDLKQKKKKITVWPRSLKSCL